MKPTPSTARRLPTTPAPVYLGVAVLAWAGFAVGTYRAPVNVAAESAVLSPESSAVVESFLRWQLPQNARIGLLQVLVTGAPLHPEILTALADDGLPVRGTKGSPILEIHALTRELDGSYTVAANVRRGFEWSGCITHVRCTMRRSNGMWQVEKRSGLMACYY